MYGILLSATARHRIDRRSTSCGQMLGDVIGNNEQNQTKRKEAWFLKIYQIQL
jgi:hypothetical protein